MQFSKFLLILKFIFVESDGLHFYDLNNYETLKSSHTFKVAKLCQRSSVTCHGDKLSRIPGIQIEAPPSRVIGFYEQKENCQFCCSEILYSCNEDCIKNEEYELVANIQNPTENSFNTCLFISFNKDEEYML